MISKISLFFFLFSASISTLFSLPAFQEEAHNKGTQKAVLSLMGEMQLMLN